MCLSQTVGFFHSVFSDYSYAKIMEYNIANQETAVLCKRYSEAEPSAFLVLVI